MAREVRDALLSVELALPDGGNKTVYSSAVDWHMAHAHAELEFTAPALSDSELPNGETHVYGLEHSDDSSNWSVVYQKMFTHTGQTGGNSELKHRAAVPANTKRYLRFYVQSSATAGDASSKKAKMEVVL